MTELNPFGLPPKEAVEWFNAKGYAISDHWTDVWQEEHAQAFTVARVAQQDLLQDIRSEVDAALSEGITLQEFKKRLRPRLQAKGWWGEKEEVDPETGETRTVKLGSPRRLKVIYHTNLRQAHSAGKWERIQRTKERRPYLRYVHRFGKQRSKHARPQHQQWHDLVRPVDDPIWDRIMPMNGWGCHCKVQQLSERDLKRYGLEVSEPVELKTRKWVNKKTGEVLNVTEGVDPGFDYNPGKARRGGGVPGSTPSPNAAPKPLKAKHGLEVGTHTPAIELQDPDIGEEVLSALDERELAILRHSKVKPRLSIRRESYNPSDGVRVAGWYGWDPRQLEVSTAHAPSMYGHPRKAGELFNFSQSRPDAMGLAQSTLHHEFGHHIAGEVGATDLAEAAFAKASQRGPFFTQYAGYEPGEYFAEAYSAYRTDPEWLRSADPDAFAMVEQALARAKVD